MPFSCSCKMSSSFVYKTLFISATMRFSIIDQHKKKKKKFDYYYLKKESLKEIVNVYECDGGNISKLKDGMFPSKN